jgi:hypothetical protein
MEGLQEFAGETEKPTMLDEMHASIYPWVLLCHLPQTSYRILQWRLVNSSVRLPPAQRELLLDHYLPCAMIALQ